MNIHIRVLSIGSLAKSTGVTAPTIRYYEEIGLLPVAARSESGQRIYDDSDIERLTFIRRCRDFGFGIDQVKVLSGLALSSDKDCTQVRDIAQQHLDDIRHKLLELRALEASLDAFVTQCNVGCAGGPGRDCVVFKDLSAQCGQCD